MIETFDFGVPPSARDAGAVRPPSERNFIYHETETQNCLSQLQRKVYYERICERPTGNGVAQLREELAYWAREIDFALSLRHELAHESMYFMVLDALDEKEEKDYAKRWERVL